MNPVEYEIAGYPWHIRIVLAIGYPNDGNHRTWYIYDSAFELYWRDETGWARDTPTRFATAELALASFGEVKVSTS